MRRSVREAIVGFTLLAALAGAQERRFPAIGLGVDVRLEGKEVDAAALVLGELVIHLVAFSRRKQAANPWPRRSRRGKPTL